MAPPPEANGVFAGNGEQRDTKPEALPGSNVPGKLIMWRTATNNRALNAERLGKKHMNTIRTTKYTLLTFLPKNLFEQFHRYANMFFLLMAIIAFIPATQALNPETAATPLLTVLLVTAIRDLLEDRRRAASDRAVNARSTRVLNPHTRKFEVTSWAEVKMGDIVHVLNNENIPADILLLSTSDSDGLAHIETANLDGETNLKVREALSATSVIMTNEDACVHSKVEMTYESPSDNLFKLDGFLTINGGKSIPFNLGNTILRGCQLRNTEWVRGAVMYVGHDTRVMMNTKGERLKRTIIDGMMNHQILGVFVILFIICTVYAALAAAFLTNELPDIWYIDEEFGSTVTTGIVTFFAYMLLLHSLVPLSAYVSVELAKILHSNFVNGDLKMYDPDTDTPANARTSALSEEVGMVRYLLSDKTGTLTQNIMEFACCSIGETVYGSYSTEKKAKADPATVNGVYNDCQHMRPMRSFVDPALFRDLRTRRAEQAYQDFIMVLSLCHTVLPNGSDLEGKGPDSYNASSPDEAALVESARDFGFSFYGKDNAGVMSLNYLGEKTRYHLLDVIEFSSERKRMTVIVEPMDGNPHDEVIVLSKGADDVMLARLDRDTDATLLRKTKEHLASFASRGLRTLVLGSRRLSRDKYNDWKNRWHDATIAVVSGQGDLKPLTEEIERGLTLVGTTAVDDKLQEFVPDTIAALKRANISVWVLTGDKQETAVSIGFSCSLLAHDMDLIFINLVKHGPREDAKARLVDALAQTGAQRLKKGQTAMNLPPVAKKYAVIVDGMSLQQIFKDAELVEDFLTVCASSVGVICCRCAPIQKAEMVHMVRKSLRAVTMAIGDGANDVSMIKEADIGVGISGLEGRQAVLAADYSIAKFSFLRRLLLVHGRWSYNRIAWLVKYFFYKNYTYILVNWWFGWFCGYSAQTIYENRYVMLYNVIFTSVPGIFVGMMDQDVSDRSATNHPELYRDSQRNARFSHPQFWLWILDSLYQSLVVFGIPLLASREGGVNHQGGAWGMWEVGTTMFTSVVILVNLKLLMDCQYITRHVLVSVIVSIALYFGFDFLYHSILTANVGNPVYYDIWHLGRSGFFWWCILLTQVTALLPSFIARYVRVQWQPSCAQIIREQERQDGMGLGPLWEVKHHDGRHDGKPTEHIPMHHLTSAQIATV